MPYSRRNINLHPNVVRKKKRKKFCITKTQGLFHLPRFLWDLDTHDSVFFLFLNNRTLKYKQIASKSESSNHSNKL